LADTAANQWTQASVQTPQGLQDHQIRLARFTREKAEIDANNNTIDEKLRMANSAELNINTRLNRPTKQSITVARASRINTHWQRSSEREIGTNEKRSGENDLGKLPSLTNKTGQTQISANRPTKQSKQLQ